jgi:hypothetical protein
LKDLSEQKKDILVEENESQYSPYIVNRFLSMNQTTIMYANEMNLRHFLPKRLQYDYYFHSIKKERRFFKYVKEDEQDNIDLIKEYFGYSKLRAKEALSILSQDDIEYMKSKLNKGGHGAKRKKA